MNAPLPIYNFYDTIREDPMTFRQFSFNELMLTEFNCPLKSKMQALWSDKNYFVYVLEGKKTWHTQDDSYELTKNSCLFVRKGGALVEQFLEDNFCVIFFFIPDAFICETLRPIEKSHLQMPNGGNPPIAFPIGMDATLTAFFQSMLSYFSRMQPPDKNLLELKFRELLLNVVDNPQNRLLSSYFCSLLHEPSTPSLRQVMEANFSYNLSLGEYAQLCNRSLSAFKRDFQKTYQTTPGKWLLAKRLRHAKGLLKNPSKTVSEAAYESGFENLSHFSRAFRAQFGVAPIALRLQKAS
jgi:AraC family transcriptional regulator, exoenzyme S synthesis regulatory protein ExsA